MTRRPATPWVAFCILGCSCAVDEEAARDIGRQRFQAVESTYDSYFDELLSDRQPKAEGGEDAAALAVEGEEASEGIIAGDASPEAAVTPPPPPRRRGEPAPAAVTTPAGSGQPAPGRRAAKGGDGASAGPAPGGRATPRPRRTPRTPRARPRASPSAATPPARSAASARRGGRVEPRPDVRERSTIDPGSSFGDDIVPRDTPPSEDPNAYVDPNSDAEAPSVHAVTFEPAEAPDGGEVVVRVTALDNLSGLASASGSLSSPTRKVYLPFALSVDEGSGDLIGRFKVPERSEAGTWRVTSLRVTDKAHNTALLAPRDNAIIQRARLEVYSSRTDAEPPKLEAISLSPPQADDGAVITVAVRAVDEVSEVSSVRGILANPSRSVQLNFYPRLNPSTGMFEGTVRLPKHSEYGDWTVTLLTITDAASNRTTLTSDDERLRQARVTVLSSTSDTIPPDLVSIYLNPARVEDGGSLEFQVVANDDLSGVKGIDGWVSSPNKGARIHFSLRSAGSANTYAGSLRVPKKAANGTWRVERLTLTDQAGNRKVLTAGDPAIDAATFEVISQE